MLTLPTDRRANKRPSDRGSAGGFRRAPPDRDWTSRPGSVINLYQQVQESFSRFGLDVDHRRIVLRRGLFEDTPDPDGPIALAHLDCDWYEPVRLCLERIGPWLTPGGFVVLDDYHDYRGRKKAVDEYLAGAPDIAVERRHPNLVLRKASPHA